jgi:hypothetical protein
MITCMAALLCVANTDHPLASDLSANNISSIEANAFAGLLSLTTLYAKVFDYPVVKQALSRAHFRLQKTVHKPTHRPLLQWLSEPPLSFNSVGCTCCC